jgi:uncharacterized protein (DUF952 family)
MNVFKVVHPAEWDAAVRAGRYPGSEKDRADGFLHFSTAEQLEATLARYYADERALVIVAACAEALGPALRFEPSTAGALYPHLYAELPLTAVRWSVAIARGADGAFALPDLMRPAPD